MKLALVPYTCGWPSALRWAFTKIKEGDDKDYNNNEEKKKRGAWIFHP